MTFCQTLINEVNLTAPASKALVFWWLGQHGFALKLGRAVIYIDLFLSEFPGRLVPPLLDPRHVTNADLVLGSHDHADHIDRPAWPLIANASPQSRFVVPRLLLPGLARDLGIADERFVGLDDGKSADLVVGSGEKVRITAIAAAHEFLDRDHETGAHPYLGYIIEANGCTVYHPGDCCVYEGLLTKLKRWRFDAVFLPINGRNAKRLAAGCIGNMTYQEAADLAGALAPRLTVPTHYEMFADNSENPELFVDYMRVKYPHLRTHLCRHGKRVILMRETERSK